MDNLDGYFLHWLHVIQAYLSQPTVLFFIIIFDIFLVTWIVKRIRIKKDKENVIERKK